MSGAISMYHRVTIVETGFYTAKLNVTMNFDRKLKTEYKMRITELMIKIVLNLKIEQHFKKWLIT